MDAEKAAKFAQDFVYPFVELMGKLRAALDNETGADLSADEVKTLMTAFQILRKEHGR